MRKELLLCLLLAITNTMLADEKLNLEAYCQQIDHAIAHSADYVAAH